MLNSDKLRLCIIQLAHDNVVNDHSERAKSYKLISWVYWWLNIYKYVQYFVWNYHVCTRFKLFKQWTQEWLYFLSVFEHCWCDIFMNYVNSLSFNIFMNITYKYILVFVNHFIKIRHLILITFMKVEEVINCFFEVEFIINNTSLLIILTSFFLINLSQNSRLNFKSSESLLENFTS